jgi:hypothetical protein
MVVGWHAQARVQFLKVCGLESRHGIVFGCGVDVTHTRFCLDL